MVREISINSYSTTNLCLDSQENGTCATLIPLYKTALEDIQTSDLQQAFFKARPLHQDDILHSVEEALRFKEYLIFTILRVIIHCEDRLG